MAGHQRRQLSEVCRYRELRAEHGKLWGGGPQKGRSTQSAVYLNQWRLRRSDVSMLP